MEDLHFATSCRACGVYDFTKVLDLGLMPPANAFLKAEELSQEEKKFPLVVYVCNNCKLLQLRDVVRPDLLFKNYDYLTGASKPLADHFVKMAQDIKRRYVRTPNDLVVEIGSNDGTLLKALGASCKTVGVDPAANVAKLATDQGVYTMNDYFSSALADIILKDFGPAKAVVANNVIAHIDNVLDVLLGVKKLIGSVGTAVFEVHWVGSLIASGGFDQIYHEHLSYFSLHAFMKLAERAGLQVVDAELMPFHGQSLRVYLASGSQKPANESLRLFLQSEKDLGLDTVEAFQKFAVKVDSAKAALRKLLDELKAAGEVVVGYGAPAKGNTLLNSIGATNQDIAYITDTTPFKQGLYTPGSHIPIFSPTHLTEVLPTAIILLAWNYSDAILAQEAGLRAKGVKFIIPVPEIQIV